MSRSRRDRSEGTQDKRLCLCLLHAPMHACCRLNKTPPVLDYLCAGALTAFRPGGRPPPPLSPPFHTEGRVE